MTTLLGVITSEPLVEVAVRQFRERAREGFSLQFRSQVWCSSGAAEEAKDKTFSHGTKLH